MILMSFESQYATSY